MSKLGKILLGLALVGALVATAYGVMIVISLNTTKTNLTQMTDAKAVSDKEAAKQKAIAEALDKANKEKDQQLTQKAAEAAALNDQLTAAKKAADDAQTAVNTAKAAADKATADLAALNATLNGQSPADLIAAKTKAEADAKAAQDEQKILQDQKQAAEAKIADMVKLINASKKGDLPPGVSGKVTFVNRTWNFVVLDIGLANGVVPNGELIVYRGNNFLGKIRVTTADTNSAVADILPDAKGDIQKGDSVLN